MILAPHSARRCPVVRAGEHAVRRAPPWATRLARIPHREDDGNDLSIPIRSARDAARLSRPRLVSLAVREEGNSSLMLISPSVSTTMSSRTLAGFRARLRGIESMKVR